MKKGLNLRIVASNNMSQRDVQGMTWPTQKNGKPHESFKECHFKSKNYCKKQKKAIVL